MIYQLQLIKFQALYKLIELVLQKVDENGCSDSDELLKYIRNLRLGLEIKNVS